MILTTMLMALGMAGAGAASAGTGAPGFAVRPLALGEGRQWIGDAVAYGPHRDGQRPGGPSPTREQLLEDLRIIAKHWHLVRTYGSVGASESLLAIIREERLPLSLALGVWIAPEEQRDSTGKVTSRCDECAASNRREIETGVRLAHEYPDLVKMLVVGNETQVYWSASRVPEARMVEVLREVRSRTAQPVTTSDDYNFWNKPESRTLAHECDFVMVHLHPLWNGALLDDAMAWIRRQYESVRALHPDRAIVIGETGWATRHGQEGDQGRLMKGAVGEAEQARFLVELRAWIASARVPTFLFEAFDENWKGGTDPADAEKHWGVFHADRTPKAAMGRNR